MSVPVQTAKPQAAQPPTTPGTRQVGGYAQAATAVASGYQRASRAELSNAELLTGGVSAIASGAAVGGPIGATVAGVLYVFGIGKGNSKRRREEKQAANLEITTQPLDAIALPYPYGYVKVKPVPVFFDVGSTVPQSATAYTGEGVYGGLFKSKTQGNDIAAVNAAATAWNGSDEAFGIHQFDLGAGGVAELIDVQYRGLSIREATVGGERNYFHYRALAVLEQPGAANEMARLFQGLDQDPEVPRTTATTFLNKAYLNLLALQWYGDPGAGFYDGQVDLDAAYLHGDKVKTPTKTGSAYGVSAAPVKSRNTFAVGLDFLTNPNKGPRGVPLSLMHLKSWHECHAIAARRFGAGAADSEDGETLTDDELREICYNLSIENGELGGFGQTQFLRDCLETLGRVNAGSNTTTTGLSGDSRILKWERGNYHKIRYSFDGEVPSNVGPSAAFNLILQTAPGAIAFRDNEGKLRVDVPDSSVASGYVQGEINDSHLLSRIDLRYPKGDENANSVVTTHPSVQRDLTDQQEVFPTPGSALATALEALDGERIETELRLDGVIDPEMAHSHGVNYLLQRRRRKGGFVTNLSPFRFLQGNKIRLRSPEQNVDVEVRILDKQVVDRTIRWHVIEYHPGDYAYYPFGVDGFAGIAQPAGGPPAPTDVSAVNDASKSAHVVEWLSADDPRVAGWHLSRAVVESGGARPAEDSDKWVSLGNVERGEPKTWVDAYLHGTWTYWYRVRSMGRGGGFSAWGYSGPASVTSSTTRVSGVVDCPGDEGADGDSIIDYKGNLWLRGKDDPWEDIGGASWNAATKTVSFAGHSLRFASPNVYTRGANNMGVGFFFTGMRLVDQGNYVALVVGEGQARAVPDNLFASGTTNATFRGIRFFSPLNVATMEARMFFAADGAGSGAAGPHLQTSAAEWFCVLRWAGSIYTLNLDPDDMDEPYNIVGTGLTEALRREIRAWKVAGGAYPDDLALGFVYRPHWVFGNVLGAALSRIPLVDTSLCVRGDAKTAGVVAQSTGVSGTVADATAARGFSKSGDFLTVGVRVAAESSAFAGTGAVTFSHFTMQYSVHGDYPVVAVFKRGGATVALEGLGERTHYLLIRLDNVVYPVYLGDATREEALLAWWQNPTAIDVAVIDLRKWLLAGDYPKAWAASTTRTWIARLPATATSSPVSFAETAPDWTGTNLKFMARDATRICLDKDGELSPWTKEPAAQFGGAGGEEVIYTAYDDADLGEALHPNNAWARGLVAATPQTVIDVVWASTLERAGYGPDKPYGFRAFRLPGDPWTVDAFGHWALDGHDGEPGQDGRLSVFGYNNLVSSGALPTTIASYRFFVGGTSAAGSGANAGGDWETVKEANWLEIQRLDKRGLPVLVLDDLTADDWLVWEPKANQWITFDVLATPTKITNGYRVNVSFASAKGEGNVASSAAVRFLFSEPRRPKPAHAKTYVYDHNVAYDLSEQGIAGSYNFYESASGETNAVQDGAGRFADLVAKAKRLWVWDTDDDDNDALAWDKMKPEDKPEVVYEVSRNQWAAWAVTSRTRAGGWVFGLELIAYDARGGLDMPLNDEILFRLSEYAEDPPGFQQLDIAPQADVTEGVASSVALTATLTGTTAALTWRWRVIAGNAAVTSITWPQSNTGATSTATLNLGAITKDTEIRVAVSARSTTEGIYLWETERFTYHAAA